MHVLRHPSEVLAFAETHHDAQITALIQQRMEELLADEDTDMEELVFIVVLELADTVADLESALKAPITTPDGSPFGKSSRRTTPVMSWCSCWRYRAMGLWSLPRWQQPISLF